MSSDFAQIYQERRGRMVDFLSQAKELFATAGYQTATFDEVRNQLTNSKFKVLIIGEFKRGKSTFINALLGEKILPSAAKPCTAIISEVKYGNEKSATIYFNDNVGELPEGLSEEAVNYINKYKSQGTIPPLTVSFDKLKDYVTITDATKDQQESVAESPFRLAEIFVPLDLCKNEVEIIDSPGLNEHKTRDAVANGYVGKADAIIFVLLSKSLAGQTEMKSIKDFEAMGNKSIFFICNQFDLLDEEEEQEEIKERARDMLLSHTDLGMRGLHFVSSKMALKARTTLHDPATQKAMEDESGFTKMEEDLRNFLINDRGRVKLTKPGEMLIEQLERKLPSDVSSEKNLLAQGLEEVQDKREKLCQELERIKGESDDSIRSLQGCISDIELSYRQELAKIMSQLPQLMNRWVQECETDAKFGVIWTSKDEIESITKELTEYAGHRAEEMLNDWNENELKPLIEKKIDDFRAKADASIEKFQKHMKNAEISFSGNDDSDTMPTISNFLNSNGLDADLLGDTLKLGIAGGIGAGIAVLLGSVVAWWILWPILLASGGLLAAFNRDSKMEKLKEKVGSELASAVAKKAAECNASTEDIQFVGELKNRVDQIAEAFSKSIADVDERAALAEETCRKKGHEIEERKELLDNIVQKAGELSGEIHNLMQEINA